MADPADDTNTNPPSDPEQDTTAPSPEDAVDQAQAAAADAESTTADAPASQAEEDALAAAAAAVNQINSDTQASDAPAIELPDFAKEFVPDGAENIQMLSDVKLNVRIELGRTHMLVEDILKLGSGAVVELDKLAGDPVDVFVNDRHVARGEVLVLNDNFCVRVSEILSAKENQDSE